jgi:hypothetical protein
MNSIHRIGVIIAGLATAAIIAAVLIGQGYVAAQQAAAQATAQAAAQAVAQASTAVGTVPATEPAPSLAPETVYINPASPRPAVRGKRPSLPVGNPPSTVTAPPTQNPPAPVTAPPPQNPPSTGTPAPAPTPPVIHIIVPGAGGDDNGGSDD